MGKPQNSSDILPTFVGEIGRLLACAEMLKNGICASRPEVDCGIDLVSHYGSETRLLQVKAKTGPNCPSDMRRGTLSSRFPVCARTLASPSGGFSVEKYRDIGVDAFVFVRIADPAFWVVPTDQIASRWNITLRDDSEWRDAWHVLKQGVPSAA